jgi:protein tyrosine phosphatase (PTP) superfamily phosphohydrolase (DUF442 family)
MKTGLLKLIGLSLCAAGLAGCSHCHKNSSCPPSGGGLGLFRPRPAAPPPGAVPPPVPAGAVAVPPGAGSWPPAPINGQPPVNGFQPPPGSFPAPPPPAPAGSFQPPPPATSGFNGSVPPGTRSYWQPADYRTAEPPTVPQLRTPVPNQPASPALPAGIPQFNYARDRVAVGLRPTADGYDWLKSNGFRGVLFLRAPGESDQLERSQVEARGLRYLTLEVAPQSLTRDAVAEFSRLIVDPANQPLLVADKDGMLTGALWYLHFRIDDRLSDDEARVRAGSLGLRDSNDDRSRELWLAIQKLMSQPV